MEEEKYSLTKETAEIMQKIMDGAEKLGLVCLKNLKESELPDICAKIAAQNSLWQEINVEDIDARKILLAFALLERFDLNKKLN